MQNLTLIQPDDAHVHFRDNRYLDCTVLATARCFARAIVMPNLVPPVTTVASALAYQKRIQTVVPKTVTFTPLMTLYLTDPISASEITLAAKNSAIIGCKWYPAGATTNSENGVTDIRNLYPILSIMEQQNLPLLVHGEVTDRTIDIFDREKYFIDTVLIPLCKNFPNLKIVLEHITTKDAVQFILESSAQIAATITIHHLLYNRNILFAAGINPHYYCLPILKHHEHQEALLNAATSGNSKFFLGTDSAPHPQHEKECACGKAGIFSAPAALELYAEVFEQRNALEKLEAFASKYAADFYGLPYNTKKVTLIKQDWVVPKHYLLDDNAVIPLRSNETVHWKMNDIN